MDGYLQLSPEERKTCLATYRGARAARRALVLLLLADGRSYRHIGIAALASPTTAPGSFTLTTKNGSTYTVDLTSSTIFGRGARPGASIGRVGDDWQ